MYSPTLDIAERRRRLTARHALAANAPTVTDATRRLVALHSSDPITPHLSMWARVEGYTTGDLDAALLTARTLWRIHGVRRTLFILDLEDASTMQIAATADIAVKERKRLFKFLTGEMTSPEANALVKRLASEVLDALCEGVERSTRDMQADIEGLNTQVTMGSGKWTQRAPIGSRLLFLMAMDADITRTRPLGSWRSSQYQWARTTSWFQTSPDPPTRDVASATLVRRYLEAFGPATFTDVKWWTGWTVKQTRKALADIDALTITLEGGAEALILPTDLDPTPPQPPTVALLPGLDPTPMGWKDRDWYLGPHKASLFDRNGNVGPTTWLDGHIVGGWAVDKNGRVLHRLLEDIGAEATEMVEAKIEALEAWLGGVPVTPRFRTPLEKALVR